MQRTFKVCINPATLALLTQGKKDDVLHFTGEETEAQSEEVVAHDNLSLVGQLAFTKGFAGGSVVKNLPANAGDARDMDSSPGLGRSSGIGNGNSLQYSCLENSMDRGAWWATVHGAAKSGTQLND